jgi:hypothetical protein
LVALLEHTPDLYLNEIQLQLLLVHNVEVSLATLLRTLKRLRYSSKKVGVRFFTCPLYIYNFFQLSWAAAECSVLQRHGYKHKISHYLPDYLVFADKAAVNILTTYHTNGTGGNKQSMQRPHVTNACGLHLE